MQEFLILAFAGFLRAALNAIAGRGSFILLPAMVLFGLSSLHANASATAAFVARFIFSLIKLFRLVASYLAEHATAYKKGKPPGLP